MFTPDEIRSHHRQLQRGRKRDAKRGETYRKKHGLSLVDASTTKSQRKQLIAQTMEKALAGDSKASELMLNRIAPPLKQQGAKVQFPLDTSDAPAAARSILQAVSEGKLSTEQGKDLLAGLNSATQINELERLAQEVARLREQVANQSTTTPVHALPVIDGECGPEDRSDRPAWDADW